MEYQEAGLILRKGALINRSWDSKVKEYVEEETEPIQALWRCIAEIADDFTLRDLFAYVSVHSEVWEHILQEPVVDILEDAKREYPPDEDDDGEVGMKYLEIYRYAEISSNENNDDVQDNYQGEGDAPSSLDIITGFHGYGTMTLTPGIELEQDAEPQVVETGYAIELSPIPHLLDYPLRYNTECAFLEDYEPVDKYLVNKLTFIDLLKNVFWELSFFGSPKERNAKSDELTEIVNDIKSGKGELIPVDIETLMGESEEYDESEDEDLELGI